MKKISRTSTKIMSKLDRSLKRMKTNKKPLKIQTFRDVIKEKKYAELAGAKTQRNFRYNKDNLKACLKNVFHLKSDSVSRKAVITDRFDGAEEDFQLRLKLTSFMKSIDEGNSSKNTSRKDIAERFGRFVERKLSRVEYKRRKTGRKKTSQSRPPNFKSLVNFGVEPEDKVRVASAFNSKTSSELKTTVRTDKSPSKRQLKYKARKEKLTKKLMRDFIFSEQLNSIDISKFHFKQRKLLKLSRNV